MLLINPSRPIAGHISAQPFTLSDVCPGPKCQRALIAVASTPAVAWYATVSVELISIHHGGTQL